MEIIKLEKHADLLHDKATIKVEISVDLMEGYEGYDLFPDSMIPDLLLAVGRKYVIEREKAAASLTKPVLKKRELI